MTTKTTPAAKKATNAKPAAPAKKATANAAAAPSKPAAPAKKPTLEKRVSDAVKKALPAARTTTPTASKKGVPDTGGMVADKLQPRKRPAPKPLAEALDILQGKPAVKKTAAPGKAYLPREERKTQLDGVIVKLLKKDGIAKLTRAAVAKAAGCSNSLLTVFYGDAAGVRKAAMHLTIVAGDRKTAEKAITDGYDFKALSRKDQQTLKAA